MCRAESEGGRRCPCTESTAGKEAHNARRRKNRAIRTAVVSWARAQGVPDEALAVLAAAAPSVAKEWADVAGAPTSVLEALPARVGKPLPVTEAYWATSQLIAAIAAIGRLQGSTPSELQLLSGDVDRIEWPDESGVNDTRRIWLVTGVEGYHKAFVGLDDDCAQEFDQGPGLQPIHEVGAWLLARELGAPWSGMVPECVLRASEGKLGSFARAVSGSTSGPVFGAVQPELLEAAAFFDALIGQQDRHLGNVLVDGDQIRLIDHGFTFAIAGDNYNITALHKYRFDNSPALTGEELRLLKRLVKSEDLFGLAGVLEEPRSEALRDRARLMLRTGRLPAVGEF
jgi:hypothetical protein